MKISKIRRAAKNPLFMCLMIAAILSSSFISVNAKSLSVQATSYASSELFNAIYFLEGDLVNQIPTLKKIKDNVTLSISPEDVALRQEITAGVMNIDPSFMDRLQNDVSSNDHYRISATVKEGGELVLLAAALTVDRSEVPDFPPISNYDLSNPTQRAAAVNAIKNYYNDDDIQAIAVLVIAVYYYLALYVLVFVAITAPDSEVFKAVSQDKSITHEQLVSDLVSL